MNVKTTVDGFFVLLMLTIVIAVLRYFGVITSPLWFVFIPFIATIVTFAFIALIVFIFALIVVMFNGV